MRLRVAVPPWQLEGAVQVREHDALPLRRDVLRAGDRRVDARWHCPGRPLEEEGRRHQLGRRSQHGRLGGSDGGFHLPGLQDHEHLGQEDDHRVRVLPRQPLAHAGVDREVQPVSLVVRAEVRDRLGVLDLPDLPDILDEPGDRRAPRLWHDRRLLHDHGGHHHQHVHADLPGEDLLQLPQLGEPGLLLGLAGGDGAGALPTLPGVRLFEEGVRPKVCAPEVVRDQAAQGDPVDRGSEAVGQTSEEEPGELQKYQGRAGARAPLQDHVLRAGPELQRLPGAGGAPVLRGLHHWSADEERQGLGLPARL
mmetsp:Transcript_142565/g.443376  ORF Transcript_142565/g.443376 Transcript_142565/m.443376 type:complete len:308 (-) Transcript_142565:684-1607(-)